MTIRIEAPHLGVAIPTDLLARLNDAGPDTARLRDLYHQTVLHVVAENVIDLTVRPDDIDALAAPGHHGIPDADVLVDHDIFQRTDNGYRLAHVDVYQRPAPGPRRSRPAAIIGYASARSEPFSAADIADLLGIDAGLAANYLGKLAREGRLCRISRGRYALPVSTVGGRPHDQFNGQLHTPETPITPSVNPGGSHQSVNQPRACVQELTTNKLTTNNQTKNTTTTTTKPKATTKPTTEKTTNKTTTALKNLTTTTETPKLEFTPRCETEPGPREATRIPLPFVVDALMHEWAQTRVPNLDIEAETEDFVDYWASKPNHARKLDWGRTWKMWMRRASDNPLSTTHLRKTPPTTSWRPPECPADMDLYGDEYAALKRRAKAAWIEARTGLRLARP